jgi:hypothetical protein
MKRSLVSTGGLIIALAGCGPTVAVRPGATPPPTAAPQTSTAQPTATPVPPAPSILVFAKYSGGRVASSAVTTLRRLDGTAINTVTSSNSDSTFDMTSNNSGYIGYSQEVLASNELYNAAGSVSVTKWAILGKDGVSRPVAPSLTPFLNQSWQTTGDARILPGIFIDGAGTLFAAESSTSGTVKYDRVNVTTGEVTTLFTATAISSAGFFTFLPENISPSGDEISFLVANATVANQTVAGLAVATFAPQTGAVVVHDLPSSIAHAFAPPPGATVGAASPAFASADGNLVVYQSAAVTNGTQTLSIHVYQVDSGQDLTIPAATHVSFSGGANSVFFSPDNTYAALLNSGGSAGGIVVVATSTGAVVKSVPISDTSTQDIALMGWTSTKDLVYVTTTAGTPGSFDPENGIAHLFDPATGSIHDYAAGLGELIAVLY